MSFTLIQAGSSLQLVDSAGAVSTLTLPTGITLSATAIPRFALYNRMIVMVNSPNRPITIDSTGVVRPLTPFPPSSAVTLASGGAGALTGDYEGWQTFVIRDGYGNILSESDFGPDPIAVFTAAANTFTATLNISPDAVTGSCLYRTTAGGAVKFLWRTIDGNVQTTSDADDLADLALDVFAAPTLGTPPDMSLIAEWRGRLWGVSKVAIDDLRYSEAGIKYAWPEDNVLPVPKLGSDTRGLIGLLTRREALIIGRRNNIQQVTGNSDSDFRVVKHTDNVGIESNESMATYKDTTFFLWKDGVYTLNADGVKNISDGKVRSWFTKDDTFNRARFQYAFGFIDPLRLRYRLFLAAAGSSNNDRWIEYDMEDGTWWGPHKTGAFTPVSGLTIPDSNDQLLPMVGSSDGYLWQEGTGSVDNTATGIDFDVTTGFQTQGDPNLEKYWGRFFMLGKAQTKGVLTVTPTLGDTNATAGAAKYYQMAKPIEDLGRLGTGTLLKLRFQHSTASEPVELYGYEVEDVHTLGVR